MNQAACSPWTGRFIVFLAIPSCGSICYNTLLPRNGLADQAMKRLENVAIVGVGLIGGSIGLAVRQRGLAGNVIGIGRRQVSLRIARRMGAVTHTTIDLGKGVADADLVIVCTPVGQIIEHVRHAARTCPEGTLITDAGSTKRLIVAALDEGLPRGCRFLGSHPLAGSEKAGPSFAQADLFDGRVAVITPTKNTRAEDFDLLEEFWQGLGSVVVRMSPEEHDQALAVTSHLPHLAAAALSAGLPEKYFRLTGTGMLDSTRLAGGDPSLWRQIVMQNRENVLSALEQYGTQLAGLHAAIRNGNEAELERILTLAKKNRDALGS
jgi:prephenate dehydrogenase